MYFRSDLAELSLTSLHTAIIDYSIISKVLKWENPDHCDRVTISSSFLNFQPQLSLTSSVTLSEKEVWVIMKITFSGCNGNENRFLGQRQCQVKCERKRRIRMQQAPSSYFLIFIFRKNSIRNYLKVYDIQFGFM